VCARRLRLWCVTSRACARRWRAGKTVAAGLSDGKVCLYDVDDSQWDRRHVCNHTAAVTALHWTSRDVPQHDSVAGFDGLDSRPLMDTALLPLPPEGTPYSYPPVEDGAATTLHVPGSTPRTVLDVLVSGDRGGTVHCTAAGYFSLGSVDVAAAASIPPCAVTSVCLAADCRAMMVVVDRGGCGVPSDVVVFDTSVLQQNAQLLVEVPSLLSRRLCARRLLLRLPAVDRAALTTAAVQRGGVRRRQVRVVAVVVVRR
jgi:hypothetical protein